MRELIGGSQDRVVKSDRGMSVICLVFGFWGLGVEGWVFFVCGRCVRVCVCVCVCVCASVCICK